jgi:hypothetical protein
MRRAGVRSEALLTSSHDSELFNRVELLADRGVTGNRDLCR